MGISNFKFIKLKNKAKVIKSFNDIQKHLSKQYEDVLDKSQLKFLTSFIEFVCCLVEEAYSKKSPENKKVSKRDEVLNHITKFLNIKLTEDEKRTIIDIIEDLHSSGRIKKVSCLTKTFYIISSFFLKKE